MKWLVTYTHNRASSLTYTFEVEAQDEEQAVMRAGMARAESFESWFAKVFFKSPVTWERLSVEQKG